MPTYIKREAIKCLNPATGEIIGEIKASSESEIKEKVQSTKDSFPFWSSLTLEKRIEFLSRIYEVIIEDKENIAKTITKTNGKPLAESYLTEIASTLQVMGYYIKKGAELLSNEPINLGLLYPTKKSHITYEPIGTVAIIKPWNYPFYLPLSAITKTLLTGNTFVFKGASSVALVSQLIEQVLEKAKLPKGVANMVYGNGSAACELIDCEVDKVVFTGSTEVGKEILKNCSTRLIPASLELGGKDPAIVFKSSNLDYAISGVLWGAFSNCGQACASIERVYVEAGIYDEFTEKITIAAKELHVGDPFDDNTDIGPLINNEQLEKVERHVNDALNKGAKLLTGGKRIKSSGFFFEPTVFCHVDHSMKIMTEETFGPVIPIMKFESEEEAIKLANDTRYGLSASIWTGGIENVKDIAKKLNCGTIWINDSLFLQAHPACPNQGFKESGYGSASIYDFVKLKHISIDEGYIVGARPKNYWWYPYKGKSRSYYDLIPVIFKLNLKAKAEAAFKTLIAFLR